MDGWFCVSRKLLSRQDLWLSEPFTRGQAWVDLLGLANHSDGRIIVRGITVPILRGQVGHSQARLAERWQWSRARVARFLDVLETEHQVKQQIGVVTSVITICNYDRYQRALQHTLQQTDSKRYTNNEGVQDPHSPRAREDGNLPAAHWPNIDDWMSHALAIGFPPQLATEEWHFQEKLRPPWRHIGNWKKHMQHLRVQWENAGKPQHWKNRYATNQPTRKQGHDRNANTANADKVGQYKRSVA